MGGRSNGRRGKGHHKAAIYDKLGAATEDWLYRTLPPDPDKVKKQQRIVKMPTINAGK